MQKEKKQWQRYKIYKTLSEKLKKKSKKSYHLNLTDKYENYIKNTYDVMKEIIGKAKLKIKKLPHRIVIDEKKKTFQSSLTSWTIKYWLENME